MGADISAGDTGGAVDAEAAGGSWYCGTAGCFDALVGLYPIHEGGTQVTMPVSASALARSFMKT